jgi:hypothetical protein
VRLRAELQWQVLRARWLRCELRDVPLERLLQRVGTMRALYAELPGGELRPGWLRWDLSVSDG